MQGIGCAASDSLHSYMYLRVLESRLEFKCPAMICDLRADCGELTTRIAKSTSLDAVQHKSYRR